MQIPTWIIILVFVGLTFYLLNRQFNLVKYLERVYDWIRGSV